MKQIKEYIIENFNCVFGANNKKAKMGSRLKLYKYIRHNNTEDDDVYALVSNIKELEEIEATGNIKTKLTHIKDIIKDGYAALIQPTYDNKIRYGWGKEENISTENVEDMKRTISVQDFSKKYWQKNKWFM